MKTKSRSRLNVEDYLIHVLSCIDPQIHVFSQKNKPSLRIDCSACCVIKIVFISALCMCNSSRIGEVVQSVGHRPSVCLLGHILEKVENPCTALKRQTWSFLNFISTTFPAISKPRAAIS